ncbi:MULTISPECIES: alpha/beta hydrolase [unclassified Microbacterium]|uniref:alpha/beta hydrolase n=1 Tax=unclassified Microbacterium TaxID=2609290 RepID=UPI00258937C2|nr:MULTISPECIES: alpha/beta hydrolase [unclassified Microbacterium]
MIGNLDGIPLRDRVTANRISIQNEIARRRSEVDDLQKQIDELSAHPTRGSSALISVLRARIAEHETYVSSYQDLLEKKWEWKDENRQPVSQVGVNVVVFDPTSSAIGSYYGPIDPQTGDIPAWVKHTAVSVPGTGANMADFSESRAQDLYLASGYDSAVFQWAGGAFPQTIPEATQASYSEKLAPRLASFVDSVNVPSGATMTVLGHSYGGATVGLAEKAGMHADRILYVSAAGMGRGVAGVEDFPNTAHVPHYSMMARHDAVVGLIQGNNGDWNAIHGQSPLNAPSVTRLETGFVDASDHGKGDMESTGVIDSHSKVFTRGSTSFDNMVAVITGSQAELFAPDDLVNTYSGAGPVFIDGVDSPDYSPHYIEVK